MKNLYIKHKDKTFILLHNEIPKNFNNTSITLGGFSNYC